MRRHRIKESVLVGLIAGLGFFNLYSIINPIRKAYFQNPVPKTYIPRKRTEYHPLRFGKNSEGQFVIGHYDPSTDTIFPATLQHPPTTQPKVLPVYGPLGNRMQYSLDALKELQKNGWDISRVLKEYPELKDELSKESPKK